MTQEIPAQSRSRPKTTTNNIETRELTDGTSIRAVAGDDTGKKFEISFSSEVPYQRWYDETEILDHSDGAVDLSRLNDIGVLLFNHDVDAVIGKVVSAEIIDKRGCAQVEFDDDDDAEKIRQKVASGTLKGVSVRYTVDAVEQVSAGATSADGHAGPCCIVRKWTPLEISIVSIPADASVGVGRDMEDNTFAAPHLLGVYERQLTINKNYL